MIIGCRIRYGVDFGCVRFTLRSDSPGFYRGPESSLCSGKGDYFFCWSQ